MRLVDFQEIRVGAGFSWNIKPLLEVNLHGGYMVDRAFNYHDNGILLTSRPSPYFTFNLQALFELSMKERLGLRPNVNNSNSQRRARASQYRSEGDAAVTRNI